jgi:hypothetical protein
VPDLPRNKNGDIDVTCGGERTYSGVPKVIDEFVPGDDLYGNDFPGAYVVPGEGISAPAVTSQMYDSVIATKYGPAAAARAQAVRGTPVELPVFEDIQSKAPEVQLDEIQPADVSAAERSRLMLLKMRERYAEETKSVTVDGRLDFNDEKCVMGLDNATIYRHPGTGESITGIELKRKFAENKQLVEQMQILKRGAAIRAEQARASAEPPAPIDSFRSRQILNGIADTSADGKAFLVEQLGAVTQEDLLEVKQDISEIKEMLKHLLSKDSSDSAVVTLTSADSTQTQTEQEFEASSNADS